MPRTTKTSHASEHEDEDRAGTGAPEVDEEDIDPEERTVSSKFGSEEDEEERAVDDDEDDIEDIDLDDLAAMEGPDA